MKKSLIAVFVCVSALVIVGFAGAATRDVASAVDPALVDVNVTLGYEGGGAAGTGIVLTSSGEVLTNNHVIRGATAVKVTDIGNGQTYTAKILGYSVNEDVAVLQLQNASGLVTATIGDSSKVTKGDSVTAIGNAGGKGGTPSTASGTITGLNQSITANDDDGGYEKLTDLLQTNAGLEPGDSGGPLVDSLGAVIGIDTAGTSSFSLGGDGSGAGFAIPIDRAMSIASQIVAGKASSSTHIGPSPLIGVTVQQAGNGGGRGYGGGFYGGGGYGGGFGDYGGGGSFTPTSGAVIAGVLPSSPANSAGLVAGDTITGLAGRSVSSPTSLTSLLMLKSPGDSVQLVWRDADGVKHTATIRLATGPPQ